MIKVLIFFSSVMLALGLAGCQRTQANQKEAIKNMEIQDKNLKTATFAGGCFWCSQADFSKLPGVAKVVSGYTGGHKENPTYEEVSSGNTGHFEAIQVFYDPAKISYETLLDYYWKQVREGVRPLH